MKSFKQDKKKVEIGDVRKLISAIPNPHFFAWDMPFRERRISTSEGMVEDRDKTIEAIWKRSRLIMYGMLKGTKWVRIQQSLLVVEGDSIPGLFNFFDHTKDGLVSELERLKARTKNAKWIEKYDDLLGWLAGHDYHAVCFSLPLEKARFSKGYSG